MATSIIPKQASEPEFVTETVKVSANLSYRSFTSTIIITPQELTGASGLTVSASNASISSVTINVEKQGYTLVGLSHATSKYYGNYGAGSFGKDGYLAGFYKKVSNTETNLPAKITISGNNLVLTPTADGATSGDEWINTTFSAPSSGQGSVYLGKITCTYIKN